MRLHYASESVCRFRAPRRLVHRPKFPEALKKPPSATHAAASSQGNACQRGLKSQPPVRQHELIAAAADSLACLSTWLSKGALGKNKRQIAWRAPLQAFAINRLPSIRHSEGSFWLMILLTRIDGVPWPLSLKHPIPSVSASSHIRQRCNYQNKEQSRPLEAEGGSYCARLAARSRRCGEDGSFTMGRSSVWSVWGRRTAIFDLRISFCPRTCFNLLLQSVLHSGIAIGESSPALGY